MKRFWYSFSIVLFALSLSGCQSPEPPQTNLNPSQMNEDRQQPEKTLIPSREESSSWEFDGEKWSGSSAPACPVPLFPELPVDIALVSGILYPGQYRGGDYKPHGGFRFDGSKPADITVKAPLDARLILGSRYIEQGEIQYLLVFENPCGVAYRFDHLLTLAPAFAQAADTLPPALPDDSRTTRFAPVIEVKRGDIIATAVGFAKSQNVGVDWGVYDLRQPNAASQNESFATRHGAYREQTFYGICWFDLLPADIAQKIRSFPASGTEGNTSDYCK